MRFTLVTASSLALGLLLAPAAVRADDKSAEDKHEKEDPAVIERRKRLALDERIEAVPEASRPAMKLVEGFRDREFRVWSSLRDELVHLGADAIPPLLIGLEELDWETRAFAASCLALVGTRAEAAALADAYDAETKFIEAQRQMILAISKIGAKSSKDVLLRAAAHADAGVRVAAVRGLGQLVDPELADELHKHAASEDLDIRYEALGALAELGDAEVIAKLIKEAKATVEGKRLARVDSLNEEDNGERYSHYLLGLALARADTPEANDLVIGAMTAEKPWNNKSFLRMGAAEGVGRRTKKDGKPHPKLVAGITHSNNAVRVACSYAAGWAEHPDLVPKLVKALSDSQLDVRHNAVMALGRISDARAVKALGKAAGDKAGEVRIGAVRSLEGIDRPESTKHIIKVTRDSKYMIRVMAVRALRYRTEQDGVIAALTKSVRDPDYGVREQALASLAHHPDGAAVMDAIAGGLKDRDHGVQTNACLGLARIAATAPVRENATIAKRVVVIYLGANQKRLEKGALECLDAIRPGAAVDPLIAGLGNDVAETRRRANLALQTIGETSFGFQHDGSGNDRAAAIKRWREWWAGRDGVLPERGARARAAITGKLSETARDLKWKGLDIALLFDSTYSMAGLVRATKERTDEIVHELNGLLPSLRVSIYTFRDYGDSYVWYGSPLTYDTWKLSGFLQNMTHGQGGDIPEANFEVTRNVMKNLDWRPDAHKVIVYAGDAPHHPESHDEFIKEIKAFCTPKNHAVLHAIYTDTNRRSLDIKSRKQRFDMSGITSPTLERYRETTNAGRGVTVPMDDESGLIKELLVLTFGQSFRADIENLLDFEY